MDDNQVVAEEKPISSKIDWKKFFLNNAWILLILIPLVITLMVRLEPMKLVPMENSVENTVTDYYRSHMKNEIISKYPNLPDDEINALVDKNFDDFMKSVDKKTLEEQIKTNSDALKSRLQYESGSKTYVYLGDIDSYYWLRMSRNIVEKGTQCDVIKEGTCYDSYTVAPNLKSKEIDYYPIAIVWVYSILKMFNPDMSLMQASFLTPLVFSLLLTIPLFLLLRRIGGNLIAVVGTVLVNVNPYVLTRSLGSDSDIVNIFFQAIFLWLAVECFYAKKPLAKYIFSFLCGLILAVYYKFWSGWWYLADLFLLSIGLNIAFVVLKEWYNEKRLEFAKIKKILTELLIVIGIFILSVSIFYGIFSGSLFNIFSVVQNQLGVLKLKVAANPSLWPNVLTTVAEFNSMSLSSVVESFGSNLNMPLFLMAILGTIFLIFPSNKFITKNILLFIGLLGFNLFLYHFLRSSSNGLLVFLLLIPVLVGMYAHLKAKEEEFHADAVFLLTIIICLVVYFSMTGVRFVFLMAIPVSLFAAIFFVRSINLVISIVKNLIGMHKIVSTLIVVALCVLFLSAPVRAGISTAQNYVPNVSDEWVATLEKIKAESKPDAIINSWWDFGHWFKYFADRRVTLDGSSQNSPQLHWLGKLLLTSDENVSRGILRMLDCGGNNAFNEINSKINDTPHSINILNSIIVERKGDAEKILSKHGFSPDEIKNVLRYSHCDAPENFLITSEDMIGKGGVWAHFGSWNFMKSYMSSVISTMPEQEIIKKFKEDYDVPEDVAKGWVDEIKSMKDQEEINLWIASWPSYYSGLQPCSKENNLSVCVFSQGENKFPFVIDFDKKEAYIPDSDGKVYPKTAAFFDGSSFELVTNSKNTFGIGIVAVKSGNDISAMFMAPELTGSMFTRLFFFDGVGLSSFEKFYDTTTVFGDRVITWKVVWDKED
jgi:dolichyl-phosphooligosaccharide-protein glycotransferase